MTRAADARTLAALAAAGCAGLLAAALLFQFVGGLAPCDLCVQQRWPHVAGVLLGLGVAFGPPGLRRPIAVLGAAAMALGLGLAIYHVGVEQGLWASACSAAPIRGLSTEELLAQIRSAPVTRCDEVAWSLLGVSMAGWNALASLALAALFGVAALRKPAA